MPGTVIGTLASVVVGYALKWLDDFYRRAQEKRATRADELKKQYELLLEFLGDPNMHFQWLLDIPDDRLGEGEPPADEKVQMIAEWTYRNRERFPEAVQRPLRRIANVSYALLVPGRREVWSTGQNRPLVDGDWQEVREYKDRVGEELFG